MSSTCAIYDHDEQYAKRLMHMISSNKNSPFFVQLFTKEDELKYYLDHNQPDILLIGEEIYTGEIASQYEGRILILVDEPKQCMISNQGQHIEEVYKYQASQQLVEEIIRKSGNFVTRQNETIQMIGIFSPDNADARISFALHTSKMLAEKGRVLYINLEEFSGLDEILPSVNQMTLSDALYHFRQNGGKANDKVRETICSGPGFDYISCVKCAEDISYIEPNQILKFATDVAQNNGYDVCILDISYAVRQQWKLLAGCREVYMPVKNDYLSKRKQQNFESYLMSCGMENILEHVYKVPLPFEKNDLSLDFWDYKEYEGGIYQFVRTYFNQNVYNS